MMTYEQTVAVFETRLSGLIADVQAMQSEADLSINDRRWFGEIFAMAKCDLYYTKQKLVEIFAALNTDYVRCVNLCPGVYKRTGKWAEVFGAEEDIINFDLMPVTEALQWTIDHGRKTGYSTSQIENARRELMDIRRSRRPVAV